MKQLSSDPTIWLDNSRIFAISAVVFLHVSALVVTGSDFATEPWWIGNFYDSIVRWCVPVFVMISGALLLGAHNEESISAFYRKRFSRILIPLLFWATFYSLLELSSGAGGMPSVMQLVRRLLSGRPHYHLWFLYMILGLYLFTPFLRKIVSVSTEREQFMLVSFMFLIAIAHSLYEGLYPSNKQSIWLTWFLQYVPYFMVGHIVRRTSSQPSKRLLFFIFASSTLATMIGCYFLSIRSGLEIGLYFYSYLSITVIPMSISIIFLLKTWSSPIASETFTKTIAPLTLGIYVVHPVIVELFITPYGIMAFSPIASIPIVALIVLATSLLGVMLINQIPFLKRTI